MAFESLTEKLQNVFKGLRSKGRLTEEDVKAALKPYSQIGKLEDVFIMIPYVETAEGTAETNAV